MLHLRASRARLLTLTACALCFPASLHAHRWGDGVTAVAHYSGGTAATSAPQRLAVRQGTISGRVTDAASGQPLAGASVQVVGTTHATRTAADGRFSLTGVPDGAQRVRVSLVGYSPAERQAEVSAARAAVLDFRLTAQAVMLEELVAVGY